MIERVFFDLAQAAVFQPRLLGGKEMTFDQYFLTLVNLSIVIAISISIAILIYAGFLYAKSEGESSKISQAKELMAGVFTGLAILILIRMILPTLGINTTGLNNLFTTKVYAETYTPPLPSSLPTTKWGDFLINIVGYYALAVVAVVAFIGVVYSGIMMVSSGGDASKFASARKSLIWSIAGIVIVILAYSIIRFVFGLFEGTGGIV